MVKNTDFEKQEWLDAIAAVIEKEGLDRARFLVDQVAQKIGGNASVSSDYCNSRALQEVLDYPGDEALEAKIEAAVRWNAVMLVLNAKKRVSASLGGHLSSFSSIAMLYEVAQQHYFKADCAAHLGDLVYFQGHSCEGNYARAFLEGRLTETHMQRFRQEINQQGLSSYPHPWLMKEFWQFPTVCLGLGPINAVYQAQFLRYLHHRNLLDTTGRRVWLFVGDGEMDEPESLGNVSLAARENLDNLTFVINCNLQRLDGLVRSNYKIIQELEAIFHGNGWHVIKLCWGKKWDALFEKDHSGALIAALNKAVDGEMQNYVARDGAYIREHFFASPELSELIADFSDEALHELFTDRGAFDRQKIHAAYQVAVNTKNKPTVILVQGIKGYGLGGTAEGQNIAHNATDMDEAQLLLFRDRFQLPISDEDAKNLKFYKPKDDSPEMRYLREKREKLGGFLPKRRTHSTVKITAPDLKTFEKHLESTGDREASTTMILGRILDTLLKDKTLGPLVAPIFSDEVRTFGMEALFRQIGIYSPHGQLYTPEDKKQLMYYKETVDGQLLECGISEAGCMSFWLAAATSYSTNNFPMLPIFIYYSMFGMQRLGDYVWSAGDVRARGFLIGGTAGRTTLEGEGLQHQDGQTLLIASYIPNCIAYDPVYGYEMAVIMQDGIRRMLQNQEDVFFYIMAMNEKYTHPAMPVGVEKGIVKGLYLFKEGNKQLKFTVQLLGSGTIFRESLEAQILLEKDFGVCAHVWSATSMTELRRDAMEVDRYNMLHPEATPKISYLETCLAAHAGPVVAATDYIRAYSDLIRPYLKRTYVTLGTDGYGRSDTRAKARHFFEVDRYYIVIAALTALVKDGKLDKSQVTLAIKKYNINPDAKNPIDVDGWV